MMQSPRDLAAPLEELHCVLVLLRFSTRIEGAKVAPPLCLRVELAGIQTVLSGWEFSNHTGLSSGHECSCCRRRKKRSAYPCLGSRTNSVV